MKVKSKPELIAELNTLGGMVNAFQMDAIRAERKLKAIEQIMAMPLHEFRPNHEVQLVRVPRKPRAA